MRLHLIHIGAMVSAAALLSSVASPVAGQSVGEAAAEGMVAGSPPLAYWRHSSGARAIIALHGGPGLSHAYLRPEFDLLAPFGSLHFYDQRGCGRSGAAAGYHWEEHVADLHRLIVAIADSASVVLVGTSWGSQLALLYALAHPERVTAMVLSGNVPWNYSPEPPPPPEMLSLSAVQGSVAISRQLTSQPPRAAHLDHLDVPWTKLGTSCPWVGIPTLQSLGSVPAPDALRTISVPVLLVRGLVDVLPPDGSGMLMELLPDVRRADLPGAGHGPWFTDPGWFAEEVERFLTEVGAIRR